MTPSVLFVCLGNICRSPLAEAAFRAEAQRVRLDVEIDSAGTGGWHAGDPPDRRAQATALRHGIDISGYRGRQVTTADFRRFTHIVALDEQNLRDLKKLKPADATASLSLMLDHAPGREGQAVADPYYGDDAGFETTLADVSAGAVGLVQALRARVA
ncbi:phosphotyrosine protein phosphatase [Brevundimonas sp. Leaf363]|uniref:low molecular weight protein-tyrosine-phosphatase n=1 Tax=Brevundimonas sp. Leaf363 TaxID=1736353 RepID=UPI0006F7695E|nr:low molecular weight protein-tyrosine-phosphatase [Brevundimonas sp. Leaf363]KQS56132.1 phosphotyrosine protein phosphatase [Brevundimonas sp. Leaf363]